MSTPIDSAKINENGTNQSKPSSRQGSNLASGTSFFGELGAESSVQSHRLRAGTLAVGTEVVDGQITDRNSGWISQMVTDAGVQVIEHRAVADDHNDITRALSELADRCDLIFVTGGLGPTSDDFTRELIAKVFAQPLEYDEASWQQILEMLATRGVVAKEIQKQQCYFPHGAQILKNPAGTANGFSMVAKWEGSRDVRVYVLPGPPSEIAAIWDLNLKNEMADLTPLDQREELVILRCLGKPESDVAEKTEAAIAGSGLRVGYRAHLPYVEVKLWVPALKRASMGPVIAKVEAALGDWIIARGKEDLADTLLKILRDTRLVSRVPVEITDFVTAGFFQERLVARTRELKYKTENMPFAIATRFGTMAAAGANAESTGSGLAAHSLTTAGSLTSATVVGASDATRFHGVGVNQNLAQPPSLTISLLPGQHGWLLELQALYLKGANGGKADLRLELIAPKHYSLDSERARKFLTEFIFLNIKEHAV